MGKKVLFQTIQFSISSQFNSIWPINRTLSGATTQAQSGPGSNGNVGVLHILQSSSITRPHHQIVQCHIHDTHWGSLTPLHRCSQCILQPQLIRQSSILASWEVACSKSKTRILFNQIGNTSRHYMPVTQLYLSLGLKIHRLYHL